MIASRGPSPIGLDIGSRAIRAVQVTMRRRRASLRRWVEFDRLEPGDPSQPLGERDAERLAATLDRHGFAGRRVVIAAPGRAAACPSVATPPRGSGAPIDQIVRQEVAREHRLPIGAAEIASWPSPARARPEGGEHVVAAALAHSTAEPILAALEKPGLWVDAIDVRAWAMVRACPVDLLAGPAIAAMLDLADEALYITVCCDGVPVYERHVATEGLDALRRAAGQSLGLDERTIERALRRGSERLGDERSPRAASLMEQVGRYAEAVAREASASIAYVAGCFDSPREERAVLMGAGAASGLIVAAVREATETRTVVLTPAERVEAEPGAGGPTLALALGLAMRGEVSRAA